MDSLFGDDERVEPSPWGNWSTAQQELIAVASKGPKALNQDFEAWAEGYHPDWSYWHVGQGGVRQRSEHMRLVREFMDTGAQIIDFTFEPLDVIIRGDTGFIRYNAVETIKGGDGVM